MFKPPTFVPTYTNLHKNLTCRHEFRVNPTIFNQITFNRKTKVKIFKGLIKQRIPTNENKTTTYILCHKIEYIISYCSQNFFPVPYVFLANVHIL